MVERERQDRQHGHDVDDEQDGERREAAREVAAEIVRDAPRHARREGEERRGHVSYRTSRGDRVELVRVIEHRRLRRAARARIVVRADRVQELGAQRRLQVGGAILDEAQAEMDVAEEGSFLRRPEERCAAELDLPAEVVEERRGEQEIRPQARMELRRLAAQRRDADGVLQQTAGVGVMPVDGRRQLAQPRRSAASATTASTTRRSPGWAISAARNSRKPSSSSLSRRMAGIRLAGSASGAGSSVRTSSWSRSRKRSTRPRTRIESPSAKRPSSSSTSLHTRASMRPLASTSSSARYAAPPFVRSRCLRATA